jgi:hypothetical protein
MDVRWNSTYLMLKTLLPHKVTFTTLIHANYPKGKEGELLLTKQHWAVAEKVFKFLELFYEAIVCCLVWCLLSYISTYASLSD